MRCFLFIAVLILAAAVLWGCTELRVAEAVWGGAQAVGYIFTPEEPFKP